MVATSSIGYLFLFFDKKEILKTAFDFFVIDAKYTFIFKNERYKICTIS
jgi:hypothetical protein